MIKTLFIKLTLPKHNSAIDSYFLQLVEDYSQVCSCEDVQIGVLKKSDLKKIQKTSTLNCFTSLSNECLVADSENTKRKYYKPIETDHFDKIIIYGTLWPKSFLETGEKIYFEKLLKNGYIDCNFNSTLNGIRIFANTYEILNANRNAKIFIIITDPQEYKWKKLFPSIIEFEPHQRLNIQSSFFFETYVFKNAVNLDLTKDYDFVFGYSAQSEYRRHLHDFAEKQLFKHQDDKKFLLFGDDRFITDETKKLHLLKQEDYYDKISHAKFSFISPAYDKDTFSIIRFFECISRQCIPIVWSTCCMTDAFKDYPDFLEFLKANHLIYDQDKDGDFYSYMYSLNYDYLIKELFKCESYTLLKDHSKMLNRIVERLSL